MAMSVLSDYMDDLYLNGDTVVCKCDAVKGLGTGVRLILRVNLLVKQTY